MASGQDLIAKAGSMIAYEGYRAVRGHPPALRRSAEEWLTGEGGTLMRCRGDGDCSTSPTTAPTSSSSISTARASRSTAPTLLAFDAQLELGVSGSRGWPSSPAGPVQRRRPGHRLGRPDQPRHSDGRRLRRREDETYVDPDALVAWTTGPEDEGQAQLQGGALIGRGSGEAYQWASRARGSSSYSRVRTAPTAFGHGADGESRHTMQSPLFAHTRSGATDRYTMQNPQLLRRRPQRPRATCSPARAAMVAFQGHGGVRR